MNPAKLRIIKLREDNNHRGRERGARQRVQCRKAQRKRGASCLPGPEGRSVLGSRAQGKVRKTEGGRARQREVLWIISWSLGFILRSMRRHERVLSNRKSWLQLDFKEDEQWFEQRQEWKHLVNNSLWQSSSDFIVCSADTSNSLTSQIFWCSSPVTSATLPWPLLTLPQALSLTSTTLTL